MTDGRIEALEHQLMRAWATGDRKVLKKLLSRKFRLVVGAASPVMLDRKSMVDAAGDRWRIGSHRLASVYVREVGSLSIFAAAVELAFTIDGKDFSGEWWMQDVWAKSAIARRWELLDRQMSMLESGSGLPPAVKALRLWR